MLAAAMPRAALAEATPLYANNNAPDTLSASVAPSVEPVPAELQGSDFTVKEIDLWARIRGGFAMPDLDNQYVANQLNWYSTRTDYIKRTVQRGSRYLYHVVEELEKRGMPLELALLPFIESAFNPQAISSAKASGMWQFMAATGRDFNLKQNMFRDDRRGILDSTDAALTYLERLYGMFGDWQLALAAYNWGEGSVQRAIKKQQALGLPTDFESLSAHMPNETKNYVPKLQAVKNIISHPDQFNIELPELLNQPYFVTVEKTRDIDVRVAAQLAELPLGEFTALNPQFNRPVITGNSNTKILLPTDNAALFRENLEKWRGPLSSWSALTLSKSERIEALSKRLKLSLAQLRDVNLIPAKTMLKAGSTILIPKPAKAQDHDIAPELADKAQLIFAKNTAPGRELSVKVGKHDNLNSIAKRYKVSVAQLKQWNNLRHERVQTGQTLHVQVAQARRSGKALAHNSHQRKAAARTLLAHHRGGKKPHG